LAASSGGLADNWHVQSAADHASDVSEQHAFVRDPVILGRGTLLKHEPVEMSSIEPMYCWPAIEPFAQIRRDALLSREANEDGNETVIAVAMDRRRKA
jgi:hypothetical protein